MGIPCRFCETVIVALPSLGMLGVSTKGNQYVVALAVFDIDLEVLVSAFGKSTWTLFVLTSCDP
jgi:hypothetical protein